MGKIIIEKLEITHDKTFADVKHEIKDGTTLTVDIHCLSGGDDIIVRKINIFYDTF